VPFLTADPIDVPSILAMVESPSRGGIASFVGAVRNHHEGRAVVRLTYSAYAPMVEAECARIVAEAEQRWPVAVALRHRIGMLEVGGVAIVAAVGAAHRDAAFEACRYVVEEVKRRAPIWKRELYADGSAAWVDPTVAHRRTTPEPVP
jgi:molybdopterin synthase catalytic subunit